MSDIVFRRIRGRIIPIKKKKEDSLKASPEKGSAKIAAGAGIGILGSVSASKDLKQSFKVFRKSAIYQGLASIQPNPSVNRNRFFRLAAMSKISGKKLRNRSKTKFGLALGLSSTLVSSGVSDMFRKDNDLSDEIGGAVGTAISAVVISKTAKRFGLKAGSITSLFSGFNVKGQRLSRAKIRKIKATKFLPKP